MWPQSGVLRGQRLHSFNWLCWSKMLLQVLNAFVLSEICQGTYKAMFRNQADGGDEMREAHSADEKAVAARDEQQEGKGVRYE